MQKTVCKHYMKLTEHHGRVVSTPYSGGPGLKPRLEDLLR
jgi:hypothetical protein